MSLSIKKLSTILFILLSICTQAEDWPMYMRDASRSGNTTAEISTNLYLQWEYSPQNLPAPAWPAPAKTDYWHREEGLKPRVIYDRANHTVTFGNNMKLAVYIGAMYRDFVNKDNNTGSLAVPELDEAMTRAIDGFTVINNEQITLWESLPNATPGKEEKLEELYARDERLVSAKDRVENSNAINYSINKEIINNWSTQIGLNFELSNHWMYRAELGYRAGQKFFMTGLQYRFGL